MKLIGTSAELLKEFKRLMLTYNQYLWSVAWADFNFELSELLVAKKSRIKKICVGLQFYGTHPAFIEKFYTHQGVRFLEQDKGTYHPKLYLFKNNATDWELLIGSGNYTTSAFTKNIEVSILLSSSDKAIGNIHEQAVEFIDTHWKNGKILTEEFVTEYKKRKLKVKTYIPKLPSKGSIHPVFEKSWKEYLAELRRAGYINRINFLDWVKAQFRSQGQFHEINLRTRQSIAGFGKGEKEVDIGCFGTTGARYSFMNKVNQKPEIISDAFKQIPSTGEVSKTDYQNFIRQFKKVSPHEELACASRLLCLWRPDYFVNFNGKNQDAICGELQIKKSKVNYETYWNLIVQPFIDSGWNKSNKAARKSERKIYNYRIALLDCIYYER